MNAEESNMTDDAVLSDGVLVDDADVTAGDNEVADTGEENAEDDVYWC